jgi:hypothetical protein
VPTETEPLTESPTQKQYEEIGRLSRDMSQSRNMSSSTTMLQSHSFSAHHPARSLSALLDTLGPLVFPIYRAALLRKRILIVGHAPVQQTCEFGELYRSTGWNVKLICLNLVYNLSLISNIPLTVQENILQPSPLMRLRPLFSVGVHDIPFLEDDNRASKASVTTPSLEEDAEVVERGWVACTTDGILATKNSLYDVLITMPPSYSAEAQTKVWPTVEAPHGTVVKATQRDLRRFRNLRWGLSRANSYDKSPSSPQPAEEQPSVIGDWPRSPHLDDAPQDIGDTDSITAPMSWSALAYSGFMWWASAGEKRYETDDEFDYDSRLLVGLDHLNATAPRSARTPSSSFENRIGRVGEPPLAIIAYFHRLTALIFKTISDIIDAVDYEYDSDSEPLRRNINDEGDEDRPIYIRSEDVSKMGLDVWSSSDRQFIVDIAREYFEVDAQIEGMNVDICGVRVC